MSLKNRRDRLQQQAAEAAAAASAPERHALHRQIKGSRREQRAEIRSAQSMATALQESIDQARREARSLDNLTPRDRALLLGGLSEQRPLVAAQLAYDVRAAGQEGRQTRSDLRSQLVDLAQQQGTTAESAFQQLLQDAKDRALQRASQHETHRHNVAMENAAAASAAADASPGGNKTASQKLSERTSFNNALREAVSQYKAADANGDVPSLSDTQAWLNFTATVYKAKGVTRRKDAERAVQVLQTALGAIPYANSQVAGPMSPDQQKALELARRLGLIPG